ncbi:MAG: hypothetical protein JOS17DRAFT_729799 [Linnemannia elongata]|nr:MAG: hypothetical protein JOS17DRAFT_729799 [Linnemannia elongata]
MNHKCLLFLSLPLLCILPRLFTLCLYSIKTPYPNVIAHTHIHQTRSPHTFSLSYSSYCLLLRVFFVISSSPVCECSFVILLFLLLALLSYYFSHTHLSHNLPNMSSIAWLFFLVAS